MKLSHVPRKLVSAVRRASRVVAYAVRRLYYGFLSGDKIDLARTVELSSGVRLRATDGGTIVLGEGVHLSRGVTVIAKGGTVELGDDVSIGEWSTITAKERVSLGAGTLVAERVTIRDQNHSIHGAGDVRLAESGFQVAPVSIGSNVWIAAGAIVLKGVNIGNDAVVAANAVVVRNVGIQLVVGGVPAREIGSRNVDAGGKE